MENQVVCCCSKQVDMDVKGQVEYVSSKRYHCTMKLTSWTASKSAYDLRPSNSLHTGTLRSTPSRATTSSPDRKELDKYQTLVLQLHDRKWCDSPPP
jgi:hypothetical protein